MKQIGCCPAGARVCGPNSSAPGNMAFTAALLMGRIAIELSIKPFVPSPAPAFGPRAEEGFGGFFQNSACSTRLRRDMIPAPICPTLDHQPPRVEIGGP